MFIYITNVKIAKKSKFFVDKKGKNLSISKNQSDLESSFYGLQDKNFKLEKLSLVKNLFKKK